MALTNAQLLSDQAIVFSDFPTEQVTISGTTYNALNMGYTNGSVYDEGGKVPVVNLRLALNRNDVTAIPTRGTTATYSSQSFRIGEVQQDDNNSPIIITLENLTLQ